MAETQLTVTQQKAMSLREYLESPNIQRQITSALPKWLTPERFFRVLFSSILKNPKIMDCTRESILISVMQCAQLGLEPILGRAHLIPYENSKKINGQWIKVLECQFQPGYQGLVDLARRSGEVKDVFSMVVYEKDIFDIEYGTNRRLVHKPYLKEEPGDPIGAYTVWEMKDGVKNFEFMPLHDLYKRRAKSQAYLYAIANPDNKKAQECPWVQWPEEQMKKTVTKHHSKLQPASIEYMQAAELDDMAEIGAPQSGFFLPSGRGMAQIEAPGPDPATLIASFDEQFGEEVKPFIKTLADHYKKTEDEIKIEAMKDTAGFTKGFVTWKAKQKPTKVYTQAPEVMRGPEPEPITYTPKPEKEPERIEKAGVKDPFREEWINLRGAGYSTYFHTHLEEFKTASPEIQQEAKAKWNKLYTEPWPLDPKPQTPAPADWTPVGGTKVPEQTAAEEVAAGIHRRHEEEKAEKKGKESNGPSIWCPAKSGFVFVAVCEQRCDKTAKCQAYQEWVYENKGPVVEYDTDPPDPREDR